MRWQVHFDTSVDEDGAQLIRPSLELVVIVTPGKPVIMIDISGTVVK